MSLTLLTLSHTRDFDFVTGFDAFSSGDKCREEEKRLGKPVSVARARK
jgi:hypothetical protein